MSFPRYPAYKPSGLEWLGEVPEHWMVIAPKRLMKSCSGGTLIKGECADEPAEHLYPAFSASGQDVWVATPDYGTSGLVLSAVGARCGKTFKADGQWGVVANTHCLFPETRQVRDFYWYLTNREEWWEKGGTAQPFVKVKETLDRPWCLPPPDEQHFIATFLDRETAKIDALIAEQQRLIQLLQEKRQAVISHAVTKGLNPEAPMKDSGVEWLGEVPEHWEVFQLNQLITKITNGYVGPTRDILQREGTRYLQSLHIKNNRILFETPYYVSEEWSAAKEKSILKEGDVLVVQTGDIGQSAVVTREFEGCNCHALIVISPRPMVLTGTWLSWVLNSTFGKETLVSIQTGALHPHLNCGNVKYISIPVPPIGEQAAICNHIAKRNLESDELIDASCKSIELMRQRRSALISAAVTGQIDVRGLVSQGDPA